MEKPIITIDEFNKLDLRVGKVIEAQPIPGRTKILKLKVDIGGEVRQMIAGGAEYYSPSYFLGKQFVVLANLKPRTIAGVESKGMLLAAAVGEKPYWLTVEETVPPGTRIM
ncbi:MAG: tRNA-binding protein [Candidatus Bathyarchaeia archaeon]